MADGTANKKTGANNAVDPDIGSQAQRTSVPHVDALKATISIALKLDLSDLASVPKAQQIVKDLEETAKKAGAHCVVDVSLGRVKETTFAGK